MFSQRLAMALPYAILLAIAAWFYHLTGQFHFTQRGNNLGPDVWPRAALAGIMLICIAQGALLLIRGRSDDTTLIGADPDGEEQQEPRSHLMLAAGLALTIAYGALVTILGFLITTFLFTVLFIYAGGYRAHATIWLSALIAAVFFTVLFQKVVYVSLPRGVPPFDGVADTLLSLF